MSDEKLHVRPFVPEMCFQELHMSNDVAGRRDDCVSPRRRISGKDGDTADEFADPLERLGPQC